MADSHLIVAVLVLSACGQYEDTNPVVNETTNTNQTEEATVNLHVWAQITEPYFAVIPEGIAVGGTQRPWITFDRNAAIEARIEPRAIEFAESLLEATRQVLQRETIISENRVFDPLIERFFTDYGISTESSHQSEENGIGLLQQAAHCGGGRGNPPPAEPHTFSNSNWPTADDVRRELTRQGYHQTSWYAVLPRYFGRNYTKPLQEVCGNNNRVWRYDANIEQVNGSPDWTYKWQHDLNPEVYDPPLWPYNQVLPNWPHSWWPAYVAWWHATHT